MNSLKFPLAGGVYLGKSSRDAVLGYPKSLHAPFVGAETPMPVRYFFVCAMSCALGIYSTLILVGGLE